MMGASAAEVGVVLDDGIVQAVPGSVGAGIRRLLVAKHTMSITEDHDHDHDHWFYLLFIPNERSSVVEDTLYGLGNHDVGEIEIVQVLGRSFDTLNAITLV